MNNQDVTKVLDFLQNPGYIKKGKYWIALKLGVSVESVQIAKKILKENVGSQDDFTTLLTEDIKPPFVEKAQAPISDTNTNNIKENKYYEESSLSVDNLTGKITSVIISDFNPKDDIEVANLHKIDLTKYRIDSYYSKRSFSGKFAHTVLARKRVVDEVTIKELMSNFSFTPKMITKEDIIINDIFAQGKMCVFNVTDFHLDKMDVKYRTVEDRIAELYKVIDSLLFQAYRYTKIDKLVYQVGSDFFNTDNWQGGTTKGTPQDNSISWDKAFKLGLEVNLTILNKLRQFTDVLEVVLVCGNHDYQKSFYMTQALEIYFREDKKVIFNSSADYRKLVTYKNIFLGFNHGDCKVDMLPTVFSKEFTKQWGEATCHVIHTGDKHHYSVKEYQGIRIKGFPALTGTDRWHNNSNYINSIRSVVVNIYSDNSQVAEFEECI